MYHPFIYHRVVRFQDTDAAGVVYFANVLSMCHEAYEAWLAAIGINLKEFFSGKTVAVPIVHAEVDFSQPMFCGETYAIHLTPLHLSGSKFKITYSIFPSDDTQPISQNPVSQAATIHVCINPQTRTRSNLPPELLQQFQETDRGQQER